MHPPAQGTLAGHRWHSGERERASRTSSRDFASASPSATWSGFSNASVTANRSAWHSLQGYIFPSALTYGW